MENNTKVLETKLKLALDILDNQNAIIFELRETAKTVIDILNLTRSRNSLENKVIYTLNSGQQDKLDDLIYSVRNKDLTSQRTPDYIKEYAKEIRIKQEILDGL